MKGDLLLRRYNWSRFSYRVSQWCTVNALCVDIELHHLSIFLLHLLFFYRAYQFSCWNRNDPSYKRLINVTADNKHFATALRVARRAVIGALEDNTAGATHYHADYVSPYWAVGEAPVKTISRHIFYKLVK